jgi:hypothetical protein
MPPPTAERPPQGLNAYWLGVWRHALKVLKEQDTWRWEQKPLLDEYVFALKGAEDARKGFKWLDKLEVYAADAAELPEIAWSTLGRIASGLPVQWDRHTKRAAALCDLLKLTPEQQSKLEPAEDDKPEDDWSSIYGDSDQAENVTPIRRRAS